MTLSQRIFRLLIAPVAIGLIAALPHIANAKPDKRSPPQITDFSVVAQPPITPGSDIDFTLEGTPRGQASVRVTGVNKTISLREVSNGVYEGTYTVSRRDQLGTQPTARVTLRVRGMAGLYVADASVMPVIPSVNIQPAVMMIAEQAAGLVRR